jgi:hypothetical protein
MDLGEMLDDLAEDASTTGDGAPGGHELWRSARRANLRAALAAAVVFTLILAGGLAIVIEQDTGSPAPVAPPFDPQALAIPNQIWIPSPWTPGTAESGPIGPLALIGTSPRQTSWFHTDSDALFGVSAATGTYRFLDLPGEAPGTGIQPVLSPNGHDIGYPLTGPVRRSDQRGRVVGFAVYDTVTGRVTSAPVATAYGLTALSLAWSGDSNHLLGLYSQNDSRPGYGHGTYGVDVNLEAHTVLPQNGATAIAGQRPGPFVGEVAYLSSRQTQIELHLVNPPLDSGPVVAFGLTEADVGLGPVSSPMASPSGGSVAFLADPASATGPKVYTGLIRSGGATVSVTAVPTGQPWVVGLSGWTNATHLLVQERPPGSSFDALPNLYTVDVHTGEVRLAVAVHGTPDNWVDPVFATDLLTRPLTTGRAPGSRFDPRIVPGVIATMLLLVLLTLALYAFSRSADTRSRRR